MSISKTLLYSLCDDAANSDDSNDFKANTVRVPHSRQSCTNFLLNSDGTYLIDCLDTRTLEAVAKTWYRTCCFSVQSWSTLHQFLSVDIWNVGLNPREHVRAICMNVVPQQSSDPWRPRHTARDETSALMNEHYKGLLGVRKATRFCLEIVLYDHLDNPSDDYSQELERIFAMLRELEQSGLDILALPRLSESIALQKALPLFYGPVPSVEDWLSRARLVHRTMRGPAEETVGIEMTEKDWKWHNLIAHSFW